jgi:hypothetical protein
MEGRGDGWWPCLEVDYDVTKLDSGSNHALGVYKICSIIKSVSFSCNYLCELGVLLGAFTICCTGHSILDL